MVSEEDRSQNWEESSFVGFMLEIAQKLKLRIHFFPVQQTNQPGVFHGLCPIVP